MKNIILILIISFLTSSFIFKNEKPQPISDGNNYHVMALSGLKMRDLPSLKGKKILTIPYNDEVELIETGENYGELAIQELKDFYIKGEWVKVRYDGKEGFVFNGYLTKIPLPQKNAMNLSDYLKNELKVSSKKYAFEKFSDDCKPEESNCVCGWKQNYYDNKIIYHTAGCEELGMQDDLTISGFKHNEVYNIFKIIFFDDNNDVENILIYNKEENIIEFSPKEGGAGCYLSIVKKGEDKYYLDYYCGC